MVASAEPLPYMREPAVKLVQPVPPPATESVPESVGVKVWVFAEPTIVRPAVRPLNVEVVVASVWVPPVCVCPSGPSAVIPPPLVESVVPTSERPEPMVRVFTGDVPLPMRIPESVVEPVPPFDTPSAVPSDNDPTAAVCAKRLVLDAVVAKKFVEVALVRRTDPLKVLLPEKVLLLARSVVDAMVMLVEPSKETPLMVRGVARVVAVLALPLMLPAMVLVKVWVPAQVLLVVVPKPREKTPVPLLYASGNVAERLVEETLLLKVVQSVLDRYPLVAPVDWVMVKAPVPLLYDSGADAEKDARDARPSEDVAVSVYVEPLPTRS